VSASPCRRFKYLRANATIDEVDLLNERSDLLNERSDLLTKRSDLLTEGSGLLFERRGLFIERRNLFIERNNLLIERNNLLIERNNHFIERSGLLVERNDLLIEMSTPRARRDASPRKALVKKDGPALLFNRESFSPAGFAGRRTLDEGRGRDSKKAVRNAASRAPAEFSAARTSLNKPARLAPGRGCARPRAGYSL
jgi:hypothetical protein